MLDKEVSLPWNLKKGKEYASEKIREENFSKLGGESEKKKKSRAMF